MLYLLYILVAAFYLNYLRTIARLRHLGLPKPVKYKNGRYWVYVDPANYLGESRFVTDDRWERGQVALQLFLAELKLLTGQLPLAHRPRIVHQDGASALVVLYCSGRTAQMLSALSAVAVIERESDIRRLDAMAAC